MIIEAAQCETALLTGNFALGEAKNKIAHMEDQNHAFRLNTFFIHQKPAQYLTEKGDPEGDKGLLKRASSHCLKMMFTL